MTFYYPPFRWWTSKGSPPPPPVTRNASGTNALGHAPSQIVGERLGPGWWVVDPCTHFIHQDSLLSLGSFHSTAQPACRPILTPRSCPGDKENWPKTLPSSSSPQGYNTGTALSPLLTCLPPKGWEPGTTHPPQ